MKILSLGIVLAAILISAAIFYMQPKQEPIYGRALVVAFSDASMESINTSEWATRDLVLQLESSCNDEQHEKTIKCLKKKLKKAITRTQSANKKLILLADSQYTNSLLMTFDEQALSSVNAVVLLKPKFDDSVATNLSSKFSTKFLIVNDLNQRNQDLISVREVTSLIRNQDNWIWSTQLIDNGVGLFAHPVLPHMVSYLVNGPINPNYEIEFDAESLWQHPTINNDEFWQQNLFIEKRTITNDIHRILNAFYAYDTSYLRHWPLQSYHAFNLLKYKNSLPQEQQGRFVTFSNLNGHKFFLDLNKYGEYLPELVIGIDDEKNLYRLTSFYRTKRYYSWEEGGPDKDMLYSQSLGAFIHFQKPLPRDEELPYLQYSSILFDSIEFTDQDPYAHIQGLSNRAFKVVTLNCLPCHSVEGVGGAAHHLDFKQVQPQPGYAKPLLSYSRPVLENFFYNQTDTAKLIGVNPNYVDRDVGTELIAWLKPE